MQQKTSKFTIWLMWSLVSFFYAYQYILRVLPNIMMTDILARFQIDASLFGQYAGFYYIGYAGMHIPIGLWLDKYGPKWILPLCIGLTVIGLLPLLWAEHWIYPSIGRLLIGMGSSAAILGVFKIVRMFFAQDKFTVVLGFSVTIGLLGAIYGGKPVNFLMQNFGSTLVLQGIIVVGIVLAIATAWVIPAQPTENAPQGWMQSVKTVLTQPRVLLTCFLAGLMVGPLEGFADVWGLEYLKTVYKLDADFASSKPSLIFLGMCFGSPFLSWLASKTKSNVGFIILSGFVMGIAFLSLLTGHFPIGLLDVLFFVIGVFCAYQILAIFQASTYVDERLISLTTACANMIIMIFGYVFHTAIGQLMTYFWDGQTSATGVPIYDAQAFTYSLAIIPIGLLAGGIGFMAMALAQKRKALTI
jgi:MFS family permease